jgi:hypothetical protein
MADRPSGDVLRLGAGIEGGSDPLSGRAPARTEASLRLGAGIEGGNDPSSGQSGRAPAQTYGCCHVVREVFGGRGLGE